MRTAERFCQGGTLNRLSDTMSFAQFRKSIRSILSNPHINRARGIANHFRWQYRKARNAFPFEQVISSSRIIAPHRRCGVSALIYSQGLYNFNNMNLLRLLLRDGGVFFDVGANIGSYTLVASESRRARVVAFEPHPRTFGYLKKNVELNCRENVVLFDVALGADNGRALLTDEAGSAANHLEPIASRRTIPVECRRADSICVELGVEPTVAKIDVEGFEYDVLVGFGRYRRSLDALLIEVNGLSDARSTGHADIHRLLLSDGFDGPFWCDFESKRLWREPIHTEDSLYFSQTFCRTLGNTGLRVEVSL